MSTHCCGERPYFSQITSGDTGGTVPIVATSETVEQKSWIDSLKTCAAESRFSTADHAGSLMNERQAEDSHFEKRLAHRYFHGFAQFATQDDIAGMIFDNGSRRGYCFGRVYDAAHNGLADVR